jgi:hypothetical protein
MSFNHHKMRGVRLKMGKWFIVLDTVSIITRCGECDGLLTCGLTAAAMFQSSQDAGSVTYLSFGTWRVDAVSIIKRCRGVCREEWSQGRNHLRHKEFQSSKDAGGYAGIRAF